MGVVPGSNNPYVVSQFLWDSPLEISSEGAAGNVQEVVIWTFPDDNFQGKTTWRETSLDALRGRREEGMICDVDGGGGRR